MFKKTVLWICVLVLLLNNGVAVYAMEDGDSGVVFSGSSDTSQLEAEIIAAVKGAIEELDVLAYNIGLSDIETIEAFLADLINSDPELFYVNPYVDYVYNESTGLVSRLYFYYDDHTDEQRKNYIKKIRTVQALVTDEMSDLDKALVLHDYLVQNCSYAYEEYLNGTLDTCGKEVYSAYGALVEGEAVCQGYTAAYSAMLAAVGIDSKSCGSSAMNHAWNLVLIDGDWYHVDTTWDDPAWNTEGKAGHYYFMLSDAEMQNRGHYDWASTISCTSDKYDDADYWWTEVESQIIWEDGKQYYLASDYPGFKLVEKDGETFTVKYENDAVWEVWENPNSYWEGAFSYLTKQGDYIYFNDKVNIYAMNLKDFQPQIIYTYTGGVGYIYGAMVYEDGYGRCNISYSPNKENDDYTVFDLKMAAPNVSVDYDTYTISTTSAMEYSLDNGMTWASCTDNMNIIDFVTDGSSKLTILFRTAASGTRFASDAVEITVIIAEEKIIQNDDNGIPDKVLYDYLLACADISGDGILTEDEAASYKDPIYVEGVNNIKGIEYFTSVQDLHIVNGSVTDISPLRDMKQLRTLSLKNQQIKDISDIGYLNELTSLDLSNNCIEDISCVTELVDLESLLVANNEISELPNLKDCNLKVWVDSEMYVDFRGNHITDTEAQQNLPQRFLDDAEWYNIQGFYQPVNSIVLNVDTLQMKVSDSYTLTAKVLPTDADDKSVSWSSDDETIVKVNDGGKVSAVGPGTATITATAADGSGAIAKCTVTVTQPVIGIELSQTNISMKLGETIAVNAAPYPANANDKTIKWYTNDTRVAIVDANGTISAVGPGNAVISVIAADGNGASAKCYVTVIEPSTRIELNKTSLNMKTGETTTLIASVYSDSANDITINWMSDDTAVAIVDANGEVVAVGPGQAVITATAADGSGATTNCTVTVTQPVTGIEMSEMSLSMKPGEITSLFAKVFPANASNKKVNWESDNVAVAMVSDSGIVSAVGSGQAVITVTAADGSGVTTSCIVTVTQPITGIEMSQTNLNMKPGEITTLNAIVFPANASNKEVNWESDNEAVAIVDAAGTVTAVGLGQAVITVTAADGSGASMSCIINVTQPIVFEDVQVDAYYAEAVQWAVENGITNGYGSATTFCPDVTCTRGQVVTFLWRAKGCPEPTSTVNPFTDIKETDYYYKAVLWAVEQGITNGYGSDTIFNPDGECTRGQVATFLWRAEGEPGMSSAVNPFVDVAASEYYYDAVLWAVANGITNGYGGSTTFAPNVSCNRAQIVTFLYRAMK